MMSRLDQTIEAGMAHAGLPGIVALVGSHDGVLYEKAFGVRGSDDATPMTPDTEFSLFSMTKAVTSVAAMQLVEQGQLNLDADIGAILPWLANPRVVTGYDDAGEPLTRPAVRPITLRRLLTHTAGFGYEFMSLEMLRSRGPGGAPPSTSKAWLKCSLLFDPGDRWEYGLSTDLVGQAVEAVSGVDLAGYFGKHIFGPLGMTRTGFFPDQSRLASMHARTPDGGVTQIPSMVALLAGGEFLSGGGGLVGTGSDYMRFLRTILNGGELDGARVLRAETVAEMSRNQIGDLRAGQLGSVVESMIVPFDLFPDMRPGWGLGFLINPQPVPGGRAAGSLAWAGLANTHFWIDPVSDRAGLVLTQLFPFGDQRLMQLLASFERAVYGMQAS